MPIQGAPSVQSLPCPHRILIMLHDLSATSTQLILILLRVLPAPPHCN